MKIVNLILNGDDRTCEDCAFVALVQNKFAAEYPEALADFFSWLPKNAVYSIVNSDFIEISPHDFINWLNTLYKNTDNHLARLLKARMQPCDRYATLYIHNKEKH